MRLKWSSGSTARRSTFPARRFRSIAMAADRCATTSTWASTPIAELRWMPSAPGQSLNWSAANGWSSSASWTTASQSTWPKRRSTRLAWTPKTICSGWKRSCVEGLSERLSFDRLVFARPRLGRSNPLPNRRMRVEKPFDELRRLALSEILVGELLHRANEGRDRGNVFPGITIGLALMSARDCVQSGHQQKTEDRYNQHDERQVRKVVESRIEHGKPVPRDHKTKHLVNQPKTKERDSDLHEDALQNVAANVVPEFVGEDGLDFIVGVVLEQSIRKNDSAGGTQTRERSVRLLRLL